jgi:hypothetical protein
MAANQITDNVNKGLTGLLDIAEKFTGVVTGVKQIVETFKPKTNPPVSSQATGAGLSTLPGVASASAPVSKMSLSAGTLLMIALAGIVIFTLVKKGK